MEKLQASPLECEDLKIPVLGFISFLKSATNKELWDEMIASINKNYETLEYEQFLDKFFDTFGSHIPGYADEYKDTFLDYIDKNFRATKGMNKDIFWDISREILSIIDVKWRLFAKKASDEQVSKMIESIHTLRKAYKDIDDSDIRISELKSMEEFLSTKTNIKQEVYNAFEKNLEMFQSEIEK